MSKELPFYSKSSLLYAAKKDSFTEESCETNSDLQTNKMSSSYFMVSISTEHLASKGIGQTGVISFSESFFPPLSWDPVCDMKIEAGLTLNGLNFFFFVFECFSAGTLLLCSLFALF